MVIELVGLHRVDHADVVGTGGDVGKEVREPHPALAMLLELASRSHQSGGVFLDEGKLGAFGKRVGHFLAVELLQHRFVFEQIKLRRRPGQEDVDAAFCLGRKMARLAGERVDYRAGSVGALLVEQRRQRDAAQATGCGREKISASDVGWVHAGWVHIV